MAKAKKKADEGSTIFRGLLGRAERALKSRRRVIKEAEEEELRKGFKRVDPNKL